MKAKLVLFTCVHNAGRSQMAAAFFRDLADPDRAKAVSAGSEPSEHVDTGMVEAMKEVGIDLSGVTPQPLTAKLQGQADFLVTMGCGEACPLIPQFRREDWTVPDPAGAPLERVRAIRDQIRRSVQELVQSRGWQR